MDDEEILKSLNTNTQPCIKTLGGRAIRFSSEKTIYRNGVFLQKKNLRIPMVK